MSKTLVAGFATVAAAFALCACQPTTTATPVDQPAVTGVHASVAPAVTTVALGKTLDVKDRRGQAQMTLADWMPVDVADLVLGPPAGGATAYKVTVRMHVAQGTYDYNTMYFEGRTPSSARVRSTLAGLADDLGSGTLQTGQDLTGSVVFEVPAGQSMTAIVLQEGLGATVATWTVV